MSIRENFHQASWQEPLITEQSEPGQRGMAVPTFDGPAADPLPPRLARPAPPALPELGQPQVLRHFMRLSQMTLGHNVAIDATVGTTTPKYPPVVNEQIARSPKLSELHPAQPADTVQGLLRLMWELGECLKALSGMDDVALQPQGGVHAIFANVLIMKAYHANYARVIDEAYESPETIAEAPHRASVAQMRFDVVEETQTPLATARLLRERWSLQHADTH